jgi:hypothetical protein
MTETSTHDVLSIAFRGASDLKDEPQHITVHGLTEQEGVLRKQQGV